MGCAATQERRLNSNEPINIAYECEIRESCSRCFSGLGSVQRPCSSELSIGSSSYHWDRVGLIRGSRFRVQIYSKVKMRLWNWNQMILLAEFSTVMPKIIDGRPMGFTSNLDLNSNSIWSFLASKIEIESISSTQTISIVFFHLVKLSYFELSET